MRARRDFGNVRKLPSGRYQARFHQPDGTMIAAPDTFPTKSDATAFLARIRADQDRGTYLDPRRGLITFAAWVNDYYMPAARKAPTTMARDRQVIDKHLLPALGKKRLSDISSLDIQQVVNTMAETLAPKTVATNCGVLSVILTGAVNDDRIARSPYRGIRNPEVRQTRRAVISRDGIDAIAAQLPIEYRLLPYLCGVLGLRWEEVIALQVRNFDLLSRPPQLHVDAAIVEVDGKILDVVTKSASADRSFGIPAFIADHIAIHLQNRQLNGASPGALIFESAKGGPLRASNFRTRIWKPATERAGYDNVTVQSLRRSAQTMWSEIGMTPKAIQERAGHSDPALSQRVYQQYSKELDRLSTEAIDRAFVSRLAFEAEDAQ